jgi:DNA-binding transcriptional LysR family regulator
VGDVWMGCPESIAAAFLPTVIRDFVRDHPGIALHVDQMATPTLELPELRARKIDFVIARLNRPLTEEQLGDDLSVEILFDDEIVVVAGTHSRWTRRRKLGLAELADAKWIQPSADSWGASLVEEMFRDRGLEIPRPSMTTFSVHLRTHLAAMGDFVTAMPRSVLNLNAKRFGLRALPVQPSPRPWPVALVTLKNRTLSPPAALFLERLRQNVHSMVATHASNAKSASSLQRNRRDGRTSPE